MALPPEGRTWYTVMGVAPGATESEVRAAYLQLARRLHPDVHAAGSTVERQLAERRMREVNAAWAVLGNSVQRARYDESLRSAVRFSTGVTPPEGTPTRPARPSDDLVRRRAQWRPYDDDEDAPLDEADFTLVSGLESFILRRAPILLAVLVALVIFVGSAYAVRRTEVPVTPTTTSQLCAYTVSSTC